MLLEIASTIFTGVLSGGATGLLGVALQQWGEAKKRSYDLEVLRENNKLTIELAAQEAANRLETAKVDAASAERLAELDALAKATAAASADYQASLAADKAGYLDKDAQKRSKFATVLMALVDFFRGIIRPGITVYAMVLQTYLLFWLHDMLLRSQIVLSQDLQTRLAMEVVGTTTYLVTTTTVWWFGVRPAQRK